MIKEIRIHSRGGQGGVTAAELIATAAYKEGKWAQAFPYFGAERRGAPVKAFARISNKEILLHSQIYNPDYVLVFAPSLIRTINVTEGLKENGIIFINTRKKPEEMTNFRNFRVATVDATGIALKLELLVAGLPVVNTAMVGAFAKVTEEFKLESVIEAIKERWSGSAGEKNAKAAEIAYNQVIRGW